MSDLTPAKRPDGSDRIDTSEKRKIPLPIPEEEDILLQTARRNIPTPHWGSEGQGGEHVRSADGEDSGVMDDFIDEDIGGGVGDPSKLTGD